jgi:hypothetical protein
LVGARAPYGTTLRMHVPAVRLSAEIEMSSGTTAYPLGTV